MSKLSIGLVLTITTLSSVYALQPSKEAKDTLVKDKANATAIQQPAVKDPVNENLSTKKSFDPFAEKSEKNNDGVATDFGDQNFEDLFFEEQETGGYAKGNRIETEEAEDLDALLCIKPEDLMLTLEPHLADNSISINLKEDKHSDAQEIPIQKITNKAAKSK
jgi:hypothetical protein